MATQGTLNQPELVALKGHRDAMRSSLMPSRRCSISASLRTRCSFPRCCRLLSSPPLPNGWSLYTIPLVAQLAFLIFIYNTDTSTALILCSSEKLACRASSLNFLHDHPLHPHLLYYRARLPFLIPCYAATTAIPKVSSIPFCIFTSCTYSWIPFSLPTHSNNFQPHPAFTIHISSHHLLVSPSHLLSAVVIVTVNSNETRKGKDPIMDIYTCY